MVNPPKFEPKTQPVVLKLPVKLDDDDSIRSAPAPEKPLVALVGALCCSTKVPALIVVAPV